MISAKSMRPARGRVLRILQVINWSVFGFTSISALSWLAVSLMVVPYPKLVAEAGGDFAAVFSITTVFCGLAVISGLALWTSMRRQAWLWYGQTALALALIATLGWAWQWL